MNRFACVLALITLLLAGPVAGVEVLPGDPLFDLQSKVFAVIDLQWKLADGLSRGDAPETGLEAFGKATNELSSAMRQALQADDQKALDFLRSLWKSLDTGARQAVFPALQQTRAGLVAGDNAAAELNRFAEYFPGYGYPEPGYTYRRGREIEREAKGVTYQQEEHSLTTHKVFDLTVNLDILNLFKKWLSGGLLRSLTVRDSGYVTYNGQPMLVFHITLETTQTVVTKANRKYEVNKVWFELLRSKGSGWGSSGSWEACGKTYQILQEITGEVVVTQVSLPGAGGPPSPVPTAPRLVALR